MKKFALRLVLLLVLCSLLVSIPEFRIARAEGEIYIRSDGSVDPVTAPISTADNVTYTLTDNINASIIIERDNIVVDGANYALQGNGSEWGINITRTINVTIRNMEIKGFQLGIYLRWSSHNSIVRSHITKNDICGIRIHNSHNNTINANNVTNNDGYGIYIGGSYATNNTITHNTFINDGLYVHDSYGNIVNNNIINGKPLVYLEDTSNSTVNNAGQVILVNCDHIQVENLNLSNTVSGIQLLDTSNSTITKNTITNNSHGVELLRSADNSIVRNTFTENIGSGISIATSSNNFVSGNNMSNNGGSIILFQSTHNKIVQNTITDAMGYGIYFTEHSDSNSVVENNLIDNHSGIEFFKSGNLIIYHNNFINNTHQVYTYDGSTSIWDDGYPSGGNYWSDYTGTDLFSGSLQNETDSDGIGDTPHIINENNRDNYPLIHPYGSIRNLDTNLTYLTIQSAISAPESLDGHTIFVEEGTYYEQVVINKTIVLIGENAETTTIDGKEVITPVVHITANNVTVTAFTIQNGGRIYGWEGGGIYITNSSRNNIVDNTITNTQYGINLKNSTKNTIFGNTIIENDVGIQFLDDLSSNNTFYHNNFTDNGWQVNSFVPSNNTWDNGYPSGGNYWSDYEGRYPNATEIDGTGIWDRPYVIDENNQDNYPIVPEFPSWTPMLLLLIVFTVAISIYKRRLLKTPNN